MMGNQAKPCVLSWRRGRESNPRIKVLQSYIHMPEVTYCQHSQRKFRSFGQLSSSRTAGREHRSGAEEDTIRITATSERRAG